MTEETASYDPFDAAMTATPRAQGPYTVFGEVQADVYPVVLVKGTGKVPFDAGQHQVDDRRTAIDIDLTPTKDGAKNVKRSLIAESNEWAKIMLPSIKALGTDLKSLNGKFVQAQLVGTGRKWTKTDADSGEVTNGEYTTFKFIAIYPGMDECIAAADEFYSRHNSAADTATPTNAVATTPDADLQRQTASKFLQPLYNACGKDPDKFALQLAGNPALSKFFTVSSPEVQALLAA